MHHASLLCCRYNNYSYSGPLTAGGQLSSEHRGSINLLAQAGARVTGGGNMFLSALGGSFKR
jgi:hypothetical protein